MEARGRAPRGEDLEEGKVRRGSAAGSRETGTRDGTDSLDASTPEAAATRGDGDFGQRHGAERKRQEGHEPPRGGEGYRRGKASEGRIPRALPA